MSLNLAILIGRLGADPESRTAQSGATFTKFRLATDRFYKGEKQTDWHRVVCFGKTAEAVATHLRKGSMVNVTGGIRYSSFEKDGVTHWSTEIFAEDVRFLGGGTGNQGHEDEGQATGVAEDDVPF